MRYVPFVRDCEVESEQGYFFYTADDALKFYYDYDSESLYVDFGRLMLAFHKFLKKYQLLGFVPEELHELVFSSDDDDENPF